MFGSRGNKKWYDFRHVLKINDRTFYWNWNLRERKEYRITLGCLSEKFGEPEEWNWPLLNGEDCRKKKADLGIWGFK